MSIDSSLNSLVTEHITDTVSNGTVTSRTEYRPRKSYEDFILVWLIANPRDIDYCSEIISVELKSIINHHETFVDPKECINYITEIKDEKLFFIISSCFVLDLIQSINELPQIDSVYILSSDEDNQKVDQTKSWRKVKSICKDLSSISSQLQTDTKRCINSLLSIDYIGSTSSEAVRLMYTKIMNDTLYNFDQTEESKKEMIEFLKQIYLDNPVQLKYIDGFEKDYTSDKAIFWYTKDSFLYRVLNRAYRVLDTDELFKMRYYIKDLLDQLDNDQSLYESPEPIDYDKKLTFYRGYGMPMNQFEKLKKNINGVIFFTQFLSTSRDRAIAIGFAVSYTTVRDQIAILLKIDILVIDCGFRMADVSIHSNFKEEQEILFKPGTAFRIIDIALDDNNNIWNVHIEYAFENDRGIPELFSYLRLHINYSGNPSVNWASCMSEMGYYDQAEQCFLLALEDPDVREDSLLLAQTHNDLGLVYKRKGEFRKALQHYEEAMESAKVHLPSKHGDVEVLLVLIYIRIGIFYTDQNDNEKALKYFNQAILSEEKSKYPDQGTIGLCKCRIAEVYRKQKRCSEALALCELAGEIYKQLLPSNHPYVGIMYKVMSHIYHSRSDYVNAIDYMKKTLTVQQDSMLLSHPSIAETFSNLCKVHYEQHKYQEALQYIKQAHDIHQYSFPSGHTQVILDKEWIVLRCTESRVTADFFFFFFTHHSILYQMASSNMCSPTPGTFSSMRYPQNTGTSQKKPFFFTIFKMGFSKFSYDLEYSKTHILVQR